MLAINVIKSSKKKHYTNRLKNHQQKGKETVAKLFRDLLEQQGHLCFHSDKVAKELNLDKAEQQADLDIPTHWPSGKKVSVSTKKQAYLLFCGNKSSIRVHFQYV